MLWSSLFCRLTVWWSMTSLGELREWRRRREREREMGEDRHTHTESETHTDRHKDKASRTPTERERERQREGRIGGHFYSLLPLSSNCLC